MAESLSRPFSSDYDIISSSHERVKLRNSNFVRTFLVYWSEQKPITNFGKSSHALVRTLEIFQGTHIGLGLLGVSRGRLCDSSSFVVLLCAYLGLQQPVVSKPKVKFLAQQRQQEGTRTTRDMHGLSTSLVFTLGLLCRQCESNSEFKGSTPK